VRIRHQGRIGVEVDGVEVGHLVCVPSGAGGNGAVGFDDESIVPSSFGLKLLSICLA
jgi:hypothetical protein